MEIGAVMTGMCECCATQSESKPRSSDLAVIFCDVDFPPMNSWPKPVQKPHLPIIVGGAFRLAARRALRYGDGILPAAPTAGSGGPEEFMPRWRQMAEEAGRDPASLSVTLGGAPEDLAVLRRNRDLGVTPMTVRLPPASEEEILPILDRWAKLMPQVKG